MAQNLFGTETPAIADASDAAEYVLATRFTPGVAGAITHGRWHFPTNAQPGDAPVQVGIYRVSDQVLLGSATFPAFPTLGAWNQVAFSSPIAVSAGATYAVAIYLAGRYVATTGYPWPKTSGDLTAGSANGWLASASGGLTWPGSQSGNAASYFADVVFEPDGAAVAGTAALTLPPIAAAATGTAAAPGAALLTLPAVRAAATGTSAVTGTAAIVLPALQLAAAGTAPVTGSAQLTLPAIRAAIVGTVDGFEPPEVSAPGPPVFTSSRPRPVLSTAARIPLTTVSRPLEAG